MRNEGRPARRWPPRKGRIVEPSDDSPHPGPITSASQAAGLRPVVLFTVLAKDSGLAWPMAVYMALTLPPSGQQRLARPAMSSPGGGCPSGSEPGTRAVTAALASLRPEHRQVIVCTFYEHLSADDAAARLGIPVRDVKRRACSALDEIRRILKERGVQVPCQPVPLPEPGRISTFRATPTQPICRPVTIK